MSDPASPFERFSEADRLLSALLTRPAGEREALLADLRSEDPELGAEIAELLRLAEEEDALLVEGGALAGELGEAFVEESVAHGGATLPVASGFRARRFGPWRIVRELGRGGMAVVYLAERADGAYEQQVALKLLQAGPLASQLVERFERERQILASLKHPHIAGLIDGGLSEDGQPWFAMEYVEGSRVDRYCDKRRLSVDQRLALFIQIVHAVQAAHRALVVHRDLKPSNILVTEEGEPRLLDFGIAKPLDPQAGTTAATRTLPMLTPEYASPEQVRGEPVTTASDVYQLGLLLYELLTGVRAQRVASRSATELERAVLEQTSPPPSVMARTGDAATRCAAARRTTAAELARRLSGDLDAIVLQALRKEPERRYASTAELAEDVRRHLAALPVAARPDSLGYRTGKFVRRHAAGVVAAAGGLLLAATLVTFYTFRVQGERDRARVEAAKAEEVAEYLVSLFEASDPNVAQGDTITARELLEQGVARARALENRPVLQATLFRVMGKIYFNLGNVEEAEGLYRQALAVWEAVGPHPEHSEEFAWALYGLGLTLARQDRYTDAEPFFRRVIEQRTRERKTDELLQSALFNRYAVLHAMDQPEAAKETFAAWEATLARATSPPDAETADRMIELALNLGFQGQIRRDLNAIDRGKTLVTDALKTLRATRGPEHPSVANALRVMADLLRIEVDLRPDPDALALADTVSREAVELHRTLYTEPSTELQMCLMARATVLRLLGEYEAAEEAAREAREIAEVVVGRDHNLWSAAEMHLARIELARGQYSNAVRRFSELRDESARSHGDDYLFTLTTDLKLGEALTGARRFEEAEARLTTAYETLVAQRGPTDRYAQDALRHLATLYDDWGKPEEAARYHALLEEAITE